MISIMSNYWAIFAEASGLPPQQLALRRLVEDLPEGCGPRRRVLVYIYIYIYVSLSLYIYIYMYIHIYV